MKKSLFFLLLLTTAFSCINPNKIEVKSVSELSVRTISTNVIALNANAEIFNGTSKITLNGFDADIVYKNNSIAMLKMGDEPIVLNKGENNLSLRLNIKINGGILGYAFMLSALSDIDNIKLNGQLLVGGKRLTFKEYPISKLLPEKTLRNIFKQ